ncbi:hypothetical protein HG530_006148 [Fusarium avenaceum]|nr:hypothetical protein HG530_006148 [Fusarium avenaceum]
MQLNGVKKPVNAAFAVIKHDSTTISILAQKGLELGKNKIAVFDEGRELTGVERRGRCVGVVEKRILIRCFDA